MDSVNLNFFSGVPTQTQINDSRFGLRPHAQSEESPSIFVYSNPGRGASGEHQN